MTNTTPAVVSIPATEPSGAQWVPRFPGSKSLNDLVSPFKENVTSFIAALEAAGASVSITSTLRPGERAFLMHWSWRIVNEGADPQNIPAMTGVNIGWNHMNSGVYSEEVSVNAAKAMVKGYGIQRLKTQPALNTNHSAGKAIDMTIAWSDYLTIKKADGTSVVINAEPKTGMNTNLKDVGASYGVIKFVDGEKDVPHWSYDGH